MKKIFSIDAETNGLWGQTFAIAAVVKDEDGEIHQFIGRCPIQEPVDKWVEENVLPEMEDIEEDCYSYDRLLYKFADFYYTYRKDADIVVHMGVPVEAKVFIDMVQYGHMNIWDGPYPLIDISAYPEINVSVDAYNEKHQLEIPFKGSSHNPLYDAWAALVAYEHYNKTHYEV